MRILYITTSFPQPEKGATIYTDLAEALHKAGHEITVAVSEQSKNMKKTAMNKDRGFDVLRIVTGNMYDVGLIEKGITFLKIPMMMKKGITKHLGKRKFDIILFESPPVTNANLVKWAKKKFSCPSYLMLKDIFPQNAVDLGIIKKNGPVSLYFRTVEKTLYKTADKIGCMSPANIEFVLKHNPSLSPNKLELFPNTKKLSDDYLCKEKVLREKYGIPNDVCVFLFGGNMGLPQYIDFLCRAITKCKEDTNLFFLFIGRGTERHKLEGTIRQEQIRNVLVLENLPRDEYEQISKECDVGLIITDIRFTIPNYPSRILTYLEYAKPVLAATDTVTDLKDIIFEAQCGEWVWSGDLDAFVQKAREMAQSPDLLKQGMNGRDYVKAHFQVERSVKLLEDYFKTIQ